jgi:hypothetical protein
MPDAVTLKQTHNTTQLKAAMVDARFDDGGVLYFPPGIFLIEDTIIVDEPIIFMGAGRAISTIKTTHASKTMFALSYGAQGAGFEQLRLTGGDTGLERTGRPVKTTIAAGSDGVVLGGGTLATLAVTDASALPAAGVVHFEARYPAVTGTPYMSTARYTSKTGNVLNGVTFSPTAAGRTIKSGDRVISTDGFAVDFGDVPNSYMQQCDILFHKNGVRSAGALQFLDDLNIREMNNINNDTSDDTASQCVLVDGYGDRYLRRLTTDNGGDWMWFAGIRVNQCASCVIADSNIINANWCLDIRPNAGLATAASSIMALNTFFDSSSIGLRIRGATANDTAHRIRFVQCWFSTMAVQPTTGGHPAGGFGVWIETDNANSIDFMACDFLQNVVGLDVTACKEWSVRASRFAGNSTAGIRVDTTTQSHQSFSITDNFIGNGAGFGPNGVGITISADLYDRYQILDNRGLDTNTTPGIIDLGTVGYVNRKNVGTNMGTGLILGTQAIGTPNLLVANTELEVVGFVVPANTLRVGTTIRFICNGLQTNTTATSTSVHRLRIGPTSLTGAIVGAFSYAMGAAARTNIPFMLMGTITILSLGAAGTAWGVVNLTTVPQVGTTLPTAMVTAAVAINTTIDNRVQFTTISGAATTTWRYLASEVQVVAA